MITSDHAPTSERTDPEVPRGWRAYHLAGGVPLLSILLPLLVIVLLFLALTGRLSDGPTDEQRAQELSESMAAALGVPADRLDAMARRTSCPGAEGGAVAEHVLRSGPNGLGTTVQQGTTAAVEYFGFDGWGNRLFVAGNDRVVRGARRDEAALVTLTPTSLEIRVAVGDCASAAVPEPAAPFEAR